MSDLRADADILERFRGVVVDDLVAVIRTCKEGDVIASPDGSATFLGFALALFFLARRSKAQQTLALDHIHRLLFVAVPVEGESGLWSLSDHEEKKRKEWRPCQEG